MKMAENVPDRHWGPGNESNPTGPAATDSPSRESIILARLNARARARKAAMSPLTNGISKPPEQYVYAVSTDSRKVEEIETEINTRNDEDTQAEISNKSDTITEGDVVEGDSTKKKKKKKRDKETKPIDEIQVPFDDKVSGVVVDESYDESPPKKKKKKKREKSDTITEEETVDSVTDTPCDTEVNGEIVEKKKRKKLKKDRKDKSFTEESRLDVGSDTACDVEVDGELVEKKKKKKHKRETGDERSTEQPSVEGGNDTICDDEGGGEPIKKKKKKKKKKRGDEEGEKDQPQDVNGIVGEASQGEQGDDVPSEPHPDSQSRGKVSKKTTTRALMDKNKQIPSTGDDEMAKSPVENGDLLGVPSTLAKTRNEKKMPIKRKAKKKPKGKKRKKVVKDQDVPGFTIIKEVETTKREELKRTLPHWLANPTVISRDLHADGASIDSIHGLDEALKKILQEENVCQFFPVQKAVIPEILAGANSLSIRYRPQDICVSAPTGSGKTLAYALPIIQALKGRTVPKIRALVLLPVQELALQVYKVFLTYTKGSGLKVGVAVGKRAFKNEQASLVGHNYAGYHSLIDILVATPGKLADHLRLTKGIDLSSLRYLVLDEADLMLAAEGGEWVNRIEQSVRGCQAASQNVLIGGFQGSGTTQYPQPSLHRLLFSATLSHDPEQLQYVTLYRPKLLIVTTRITPGVMKDKSDGTVVGQYIRPVELKEDYAIVDESVKPLILHHLITTKSWRKVLVFTNSVKATHKLAVLLSVLSEGLRIAEFSSKMKERKTIVSKFASGKIDVLVSSDAMARGLDIPDIEHVVSYDVTSAKTHVHRIGRTARAGKPGTALSLVTKDTRDDFKAVLSSGGNATELTISTEELEPYETLYINALAKMKEILHEENLKLREKEVMEARVSKSTQQRERKWQRETQRGRRKGLVKRLQRPFRNGITTLSDDLVYYLLSHSS